jgi:hypothetical protein
MSSKDYLKSILHILCLAILNFYKLPCVKVAQEFLKPYLLGDVIVDTLCWATVV